MNQAKHQANYECESAQESPTVEEMHARLASIIADGHGKRKVFIMEVDGLTHAIAISDVFAAEEYDGDIVWITTKG